MSGGRYIGRARIEAHKRERAARRRGMADGAAIALGGLLLALGAVHTASPAPSGDTWRAVVEWPDGESDIVEHGATLDDCRAALAHYDAGAEVSYCEREPDA